MSWAINSTPSQTIVLTPADRRKGEYHRIRVTYGRDTALIVLDDDELMELASYCVRAVHGDPDEC